MRLWGSYGVSVVRILQKIDYVIMAPYCISITPHKTGVLPVHQLLFVQQLDQANDKENIKVLHYWPFVRGIHLVNVGIPLTNGQ